MENNNNNTTTTRITRQTTMMSMTSGVAQPEPLVPGPLLQPLPHQPPQPLALVPEQQRGHRQPAPIRRPRLLPNRPSQLSELHLQLQQQQQQQQQLQQHQLQPQQQPPQQPPPLLPIQLPPNHDQPFPLLNGFDDILDIIEIED